MYVLVDVNEYVHESSMDVKSRLSFIHWCILIAILPDISGNTYSFTIRLTDIAFRLFIYLKLVLRERELFYLTTHSTHSIYGYMSSVIWLRTLLIERKETRCRHIGYSYRLAARVLLYAPDMIAHTTAFVTPVVEHWLEREIAQWVHPMKGRSDDPSHHERTLYV